MVRTPRPSFQSLVRSLIFLGLLTFPSIALAGGFLDNIGREAGSCLSGGCDVIWHVNQRVDSGIRSKMEAASEPVKQAAIEVIKELFKNNLDPLLERMNVISQQRLGQIDTIVQNAIGAVSALQSNLTEDIKNKIIVEAAKQIKELSKSLVDDLKCAETITAGKVQEVIDENLGFLKNLSKAWQWGSNECEKNLDPKNYWTVYSSLKCTYEIKIGNAQTIEEMEFFYGAALEASSKAKCVLLSDQNKRQAEADEQRYFARLNIWKLAQQ